MTTAPKIRESLQEYGRGIAGGMLFSLPLLYTMEVWWAGFLAEPSELLAYICVSFLLLLGYNRYAGMRADSSFLEVAIDSVEEMGIGIVISTLVLWLLGRITAEMPATEILGKIVVAAMTVAVGVSVGTAQLGGGGDESRSGKAGEDGPPSTRGQLVLAFCGAVLFAANVAPTQEILIMGLEATNARLLGVIALSLAVGALIFYHSDFVGTKQYVRRDGTFWTLFGLVTSYAAALVASTMMLWFFDRLEADATWTNLSLIVVLGFPAMLGASAGRLLIQ